MCKLFLIILFLFISCDENTEDPPEVNVNDYSIFVSLQGSDKVAIIDSNLEFQDTICIDSSCNANDAIDQGPHDIAIDSQNGYWFTTKMNSNVVDMYSLETNELLSSFTTGRMPALITLDQESKLIYISRGMPMAGEDTNIIYELSYSNGFLDSTPINEWDVTFNYAHGINFNKDDSHVYVTSKTNDFIAKINPQEPFSGTNPLLVSMDALINEDAPTPVNRLVPIQITSKYPYIFIACSGKADEIPGQVQMWDMNQMILLETIEFGINSHPWHIEVSPIEDKVFVTLSGNEIENSGVACIEYGISNNQITLQELWKTTSSNYGTLHGITVQSDCDGNNYVYATGRIDGNIYKFDALTGEQIGSAQDLANTSAAATGGIDSYSPYCDTCSD
ncbi:hypothetical protein N9597_01610 [Candidatus Marinimicrobia bacterium]|nr:hypothetical protein [Candidatus Neomarinimicrobiota bacterium]